MASIQRSRGGWRVQVVVDGRRLSRCFKRKAEAKAWAIQQEYYYRCQVILDFRIKNQRINVLICV